MVLLGWIMQFVNVKGKGYLLFVIYDILTSCGQKIAFRIQKNYLRDKKEDFNLDIHNCFMSQTCPIIGCFLAVSKRGVRFSFHICF